MKHEKLRKWALGAEFVSGFAVVVTLIFLTLGLRDNTNTTRTLVYQQLLGAINDQNIAIMQNEELSTLWIGRGTWDIDALSQQQRARLILMARINFRTLDAAYYASQYGTLGISERSRFEQASCGFYRDVSEAIREDSLHVVSAEFRDFLKRSCE